MGRPKNPVPTYLEHKPTGQARVRVDGRDVYLGKWNSPESKKEYRRICAEIESGAAAAAPAPAGGRTVVAVLAAFWKHAREHYKDADGKPTSEIGWLVESLEPVLDLYGDTPAAEFGPLALKTVRNVWVKKGLARTTVNARTNRVRRVFKWAASEELVPVAVYQALATVAGLKAGRTAAAESKPVGPVADLHLAAAAACMVPILRAMVLSQRLTGMRPGEIRRMKPEQVERTGDLWVYRPPKHKTRHRGGVREVLVGPAAQEILRPLLDATSAGEVVFSPLKARIERYTTLRSNRKSKVQPSQASRAKPSDVLKRRTRPMYSKETYAQAVRRACDRAGVPAWHPNQLRHTFATEVRSRHGLEAAQVLLGHRKADVTQVYAERDRKLAEGVAAAIG